MTNLHDVGIFLWADDENRQSINNAGSNGPQTPPEEARGAVGAGGGKKRVEEEGHLLQSLGSNVTVILFLQYRLLPILYLSMGPLSKYYRFLFLNTK